MTELGASVQGAEGVPGSRRWTAPDFLFGMFATGAACLLAFGPMEAFDFFWHLNVGRYVAEHGRPPTQNLWSFTAPTHPFAATSWLFGWVCHRLYEIGGLKAVHACVAVIISTAFAVSFLCARLLGARASLAAVLAACGALASEVRFTPRPHAFSYLFLSLTLLLLLHARSSGRRWPLWATPFVIALASNFHSGAVFSVATVGCFCSAEVISKRQKAVFARCALLAGACLLGFLANPSGVETVKYVLFHVGEVDSVLSLSEFETPGLRSHAVFWLLFGICICLQLLSLWRRRPDILGLLLTVTFGLLAAQTVRLVPKFLLVALPFAALHGSSLLQLWSQRMGRVPRWGLQAVASGALMIACAAASPKPLSHFVQRLQVGPNPYRHAEGMAQYVLRRGITGNCFASWEQSGFVEWRLPQSPVFVDPRLLAYPASLFRALESADTDTAQFQALLDKYGTEWAFRGNAFVRLSGVGRFSPESWAVVYWDAAGQVALRRDLPRFEQIVKEDEMRFFLPASNPVNSFRQLKGEEKEQWFQELMRVAQTVPPVAKAHVGLCLELAARRELRSASEHCDVAIETSNAQRRFSPELSERTALASALVHLGEQARRDPGDSALAARAYELALKEVPDAIPAKVGLGWVSLAEDPAKARKIFAEVLETNPNHESARKGLAQAERMLAAVAR